jgi:hypothetical protein
MSEEITDVKVSNQELLASIIDAADGSLKNASAAGTKMIKRRIREAGFARKILPFQTVTESDVTRLPDSDMPVVVEEMEPDSLGAKAVPFEHPSADDV